MATHGRMSAARPAAAFDSQRGSASSARPTATASQSPRVSAASAADGREKPLTATTGMSIRLRTYAPAER